MSDSDPPGGNLLSEFKFLVAEQNFFVSLFRCVVFQKRLLRIVIKRCSISTSAYTGEVKLPR